ncbi:MAG: hypothetical protein V1664_03655 [Candidatus Uhrbacteria bacterium]
MPKNEHPMQPQTEMGGSKIEEETEPRNLAKLFETIQLECRDSNTPFSTMLLKIIEQTQTLLLPDILNGQINLDPQIIKKLILLLAQEEIDSKEENYKILDPDLNLNLHKKLFFPRATSLIGLINFLRGSVSPQKNNRSVV